MARITEEMKEVAGKTKGFALATATKDGDPHVIPVGFGKVLSDDEILLVAVFMKKTLENIKANPEVAVSLWDMGSFKGYEFKGKARIETSGNVFDDSVKMVKSMMPQLSAKGAVIVKVDSIFVTSPGPDAGKKVG
ncbi:MAG: pyridoxamine 5'-phosphate oxidase family protein [Chloroflexi bacterium]|nr:pyridoxamine 5'-phosphate oxidase family protein [Chloroflexota bacterium]